MSDTIYLVDGGRLTALKPAEPPDENRLQTLIAEHSDPMGEEDGDLLLVCREQAVADCEEGPARWSLDHLFVTRGAGRYPCHLNRSGRVAISFGWNWMHPGLRDQECRQVLLDRFTEAVGPLSCANLRGYPSFPIERLADSAVAEKLKNVLRGCLAFALVENGASANAVSAHP